MQEPCLTCHQHHNRFVVSSPNSNQRCFFATYPPPPLEFSGCVKYASPMTQYAKSWYVNKCAKQKSDQFVLNLIWEGAANIRSSVTTEGNLNFIGSKLFLPRGSTMAEPDLLLI